MALNQKTKFILLFVFAIIIILAFVFLVHILLKNDEPPGVTPSVTPSVTPGVTPPEELEEEAVCSGGLVQPNCNINSGTIAKTQTACPQRFVKSSESTTGYMQCRWDAVRSSCNMWAGGEQSSDGIECSVSGKPTCETGSAWNGANTDLTQRSAELSLCDCPVGKTAKLHGNLWRCL